jgi:methylated-DNA-[protein]-cysteine S-methyltransferase
MTRHFTTLASPLGELMLTSDGSALTGLFLEEHAGSPRSAPRANWTRSEAPFRETIAQLRAYFAGERRSFALPLAGEGTDFQKSVWAALATIPFGETRTYAEIAAYIGKPGAARAVGLANGSNPISIIVPCHRVIGASGSLTGYGGGLERKRWLLEHEGALATA